jgi:hypothetical protein
MTTAEICVEIQGLQRRRAATLKLRNMQANALRSIVATSLGYHAGLDEKNRAKLFTEAAAVIAAVRGGEDVDTPWRPIISATLVGIDAHDGQKKALEKAMVKYARRLPVIGWVNAPEQRGFGGLFLAIVVGEAGDLANYANPAKLWKRMGCAPHQYAGVTQMPSTWRGGKPQKLPADEWATVGYSPRRRSIAYLIGEGIVKQNTVRAGGESASATEGAPAPGPYRLRYETAKAALAAAHPDDPSYPKLRCHRHGMLLATKMLLRRLWIEWNQTGGDSSAVTDSPGAAV